MRTVSLKLVLALILVVIGLSSFGQEVQWEGMAQMPLGGLWTQNSTVVVNCKIYTVGFLSGGDAIDRFIMFDPAAGSRGTWTELAPMQVTGQWPTYLCSAAYVNGKIYVMGGRDVANGVPVDFTRVYDVATDTWSAGTPMPVANRGHAAGVYNNKIYIFGGNTGAYQKTLRIYDPVADTWTTGANMPQNVAYGSVAFNPNDNKFYYFGGDDGTGTYWGTCWIYDPVANSWSNTGSSMVQAIDQAGWAMDTVRNRIYVFSGVDGAGIWNVCQYYDINANTWTQFEFMPIAQYRQGAWAAYACDGYIYVGGGYAGGDLANVLRYDPATDTYPGLRTQPDWNYSQQGGPISGVVGGKMYFIGGDGTFDGQVYVYDPASGPGTDSWTLGANFEPAPRAYGVGGTYNNEIYCTTGLDASYVPITTTYKYTPATDSWTGPLATIGTPRSYAGGCVLGDKLYVFGGEDASYAYLNSAEVYDMTNDTWSYISPMPTAREGMAAAAVNGKIYLFGGWDSVSTNGISDEVVEYDPVGDSYSVVSNIPNVDPANQTSGYAYSSAVVHNGFVYVFYGLYYSTYASNYYSASDVNIYNPASNSWFYSGGVTWRAWHTVPLFGNFVAVFGGADVGNGTYEPSVDFGTLVDDAFPTVAITNPTQDQILTASPVTINATASDDHGVTKVDFYYSTVSGGPRTLIGTDTTASYSASWNITGFADGSYFLTADATDTNSQTTESAEVGVIINLTGDAAPTVTVTSPLASQIVIGNIDLSATAVDDKGITNVEFIVDGNSVGSTTSHVGTTYSLAWDSSTVSNGTHFIQAKATDTISQKTTSSTVQFSTNNTDDPPTVDLTEPVTGTVHGNVNLAATASDDHGVTKVDFYAGTTLISSDTTSPYTASYDTSGTNGAITFKAVATDTKGQTAEDTVATTADNPAITKVSKKGNPFRIIINGSNFKTGCVVKVDGVAQGTTKYKSSTKVVLKGYKPAKGAPHTYTVENPDGGISNGVDYTRP